MDALGRSRDKRVIKALKVLRKYARAGPGRFPRAIAFDWNGTVDARNTGVGIPLAALVALKDAGKDVVVYTSSVNGAGKAFMREVLDSYGIRYTGKEGVLDRVDMFVGDKASDERKAGRRGAKFVYVGDFDLAEMVK